jgi:hypothetical protein
MLSESLLPTPIAQDFGSTPVCYADAAGSTYLSNGYVSYRIFQGALRAWGIETPARQPDAAYANIGILSIGTYLISCTFVDADGEESGCELPTVAVLTALGGIQLTNMPAPLSAQALFVRVYMSTVDGSILYRQVDLPAGTTEYTITAATSDGAVLRTELLNPVPPGTSIAHCKGRMYSALGNVLYYSEPLWYGLCSLNTNFQMFPAPITLLVAVPDGLFVCADKTYFYAGADSQDPLRVVAPYGAVANSASLIPNSTDVMWLSTRGLVRAATDGSLKALTEGAIAMQFAGDGASIYREQNGIKQYVSTATQAEVSSLAASSYMEADIIRGGI